MRGDTQPLQFRAGFVAVDRVGSNRRCDSTASACFILDRFVAQKQYLHEQDIL